MGDIEQLKATRKGKKSTATKEIHAIEKFIAEEDIDEVYERLDKLKGYFKEFEEAHEAYHALLTEEKPQDDSDSYFLQTQTNYIATLTGTKKWLRGNGVVVEVKASKVKAEMTANPPTNDSSASNVSNQNDQRLKKDEVDKESIDISKSELLSAIHTPACELDTFTGDPMRYHSFMAVFDENIGDTNMKPSYKLSRLLQFTGGEAKTAILPCGIVGGQRGYDQAREILHRRFGDDHLVSELIIKSVMEGKRVHSPKELQALADELLNCHVTLLNMDKLDEIDTQGCIRDIAKRLQYRLRERWRKIALAMKAEKKKYPDFSRFVEFVVKEADEAMDPVYGSVEGPSQYRDRKPASSSFSTSTRQYAPRKYSCKACNEEHSLFSCPTFKGMKPPERLKFVKNHNLCENCLYSNHKTSECRKSTVCGVPGCEKRHTKFIHVDEATPSRHPPASRNVREASSNRVEVVNATHDACADFHVPVVPVVVNEAMKINVLLDTASTNTFCTQRLVDNLGVKGKSTKLTLSTLTSRGESRETMLVDLNVRSIDGKNCLKLCNVYVVREIPASLPAVSVKHYSHLRELPLGHVGPTVDILIGQDHSAALIPLQSAYGNPDEPFAIRTLLGWSLNGPSTSNDRLGGKVVSHFISASLEEKVEQLWHIENDNVGQKTSLSPQDQEVLQLWDNESCVDDNHYVLPIPWKDNVSIPNNLYVAMSRLKSLRTSLVKKDLISKYDAEISKLLAKGYAEKVPEAIVKDGKAWYLPHQAVISEKKPGKVRVVFDCAARYKGESLNDKALQGPDLNNKLQHVLLRFRRHQFAVMADVEAMYNQVRVPAKDRDFLRFLWEDEEQTIQHYRMCSHLFGGVWCASAATYALRRAVEDSNDVSNLVRDTVNNSFYVDDCLQSVSSKEEAIEVIHGTKKVLQSRGFNLTKFVVNDGLLLKEVSEDERASEVKDFQADNTSKALGVKWNPKSDIMYFDIDVTKSEPVSRRAMLSLLSSTFDPLGMLSPVLVVGKIMFQEATRLKLDWDDKIPHELLNRWCRWVQALQMVSSLKIPRCIKPTEFDDAHLEVHNFSDASEKALGVCSYLRCINKDGKVHTALLYSKSRVAPLKTASIPRLELQAALLAAKCDSMIREELHLNLAESHFWVDSQIVLQYINNEKHRLHVYVGNRVGEIRRLTQPHQWHHIPGIQNPADVISRGTSPDDLLKSRWLVGPEFLSDYKNNWRPEKEIEILPSHDPEVRSNDANVKTVLVTNVKTHPLDVLMDHFSSWYKLKRAVCWWNRLIHQLKSKVKPPAAALTVAEIKDAKVKIIRHVQAQQYGEDVKRLKNGTALAKDSSLKDLTPFLDPDHVLRVGGRIQHASMQESKKHPFIIPHHHRVARLIIEELHNIAHLGVEWTLSMLRTKYWVTRARVVIKSVRSACVTCKKLFAGPCMQKMADLPVERLTPGKPPFTYVGMDCFGPFLVKLARSTVKRYGLILTCMTTRAIHIEKIDFLDADSFLNAIRRFISRRGCPVKVFCDNGTNFVGGISELEKGWKEMNKRKIQEFASRQQIEWTFNPPHASHMGGVWERMIRVIRRVFTAIVKDSRLTDEILLTLFAEAECIINSRPITKVSDNPDDLSALSPNHLLLMKQNLEVPPGDFKLGDMYRKRWRYTQHLANQFWRRWQKEYIPELMKRNKWTAVQRNIQVSDLVLLMQESMPRGLWPLGVVVEVMNGRDGLVRSARVRTAATELVRPITKIVLLEGVA